MSKQANCKMTQHEVALELGVSQATVLSLEQSALRKLRANPAMLELLKLVRFSPNYNELKGKQ
jgi:DNA-binding XRE family transcriptional regulator